MDWKDLQQEWENGEEFMRCQTSGSTGSPREILLPKREMKNSAVRTIRFFNLSNTSLLYSCISPEFIGGKMMLIRALISGASFSSETPSSHPLSKYSGDKIDLLSVVPTQMISLLENKNILSGIKNILIGGAPIPDDLRCKIASSGLNAWESYGMTETASHIAIRPVTDPESNFYPLDGIYISLIDDCLKIDIKGWKSFVTNDIAEIFPDGSFKIIGRADNVFISGGIKIHPEKLERILFPHFNFPFMISSKPDPFWGRICILITQNPDISDNEILNICRENLDRKFVPKEIIHSEIPYTANGKIQRLGRFPNI